MAGALHGSTLFCSCFVCLFGKKMSQFTVLKGPPLVALPGARRAGNACGQSNMAEGLCHLATRYDTVLRLDSALQRVPLLEWVHNVCGCQISKGEIIIAFIRKLTAGI